MQQRGWGRGNGYWGKGEYAGKGGDPSKGAGRGRGRESSSWSSSYGQQRWSEATVRSPWQHTRYT
jgi:hypothetical protein